MEIKAKDKIRGIVYAYTQEKRYDMVKDLGIEYIRLNVPFPWTDKMHGTVSPGWEKIKDEFREAVAAGLKVMPSTPGMGGWGYDEVHQQGVEAYFAHANRETLLIPQCETAGCLEHIEEITALDGVDGIFVGPFDLSIALGKPMAFDCPEMKAAMQRILDACHKNGKIAFIFCGDAATARARAAEGYDSVTTALDALMLTDAYRSLVRDIRA